MWGVKQYKRLKRVCVSLASKETYRESENAKKMVEFDDVVCARQSAAIRREKGMSGYVVLVDFRLKPGTLAAFRDLIDANARQSAKAVNLSSQLKYIL